LQNLQIAVNGVDILKRHPYLKKENQFWATFYMDTVFCEKDPYPYRKKLIEKSKILKVSDRNYVIKYIDSFMVASKKEQNALSNASCFFRVINKDTTVKFIDWTMEWKEFGTMRDEIFD